MGLLDGLKEKAKAFSVKILLGKMVEKGVIAFLASIAGFTQLLPQYGVTLQLDQALLSSTIIGIITGMIEGGRNPLKFFTKK